MVENQPPEPPTDPGQPTESGAALPALPGPATPAPLPPGLDADEYRRFQEFQRFQDYQRFVAAQSAGNLPTPPSGQLVPTQPAPPAPQPGYGIEHHLAGMHHQLTRLTEGQAKIDRAVNPPLWRKILRSRLVRGAISLALILVVAFVAFQHFFGSSGGDSGGGSQHPGAITGSGRLAANPGDAVAAVYHLVGEGGSAVSLACEEFSPIAATQFAHDYGTDNCLAAVSAISSGLSAQDKGGYSNAGVPDTALTQSGSTARISSCRMTVGSGPRLGLFILTEVGDNEWQITGHSKEPDPCPAIAPPTS